MTRIKGWALLGLLLTLALGACEKSDRFVGQYAVKPDGIAQFRISSDGNLYVLEKRHGDNWGDRRELDKMACPEALTKLEQTLAAQQPKLICLGQQGALLAALLYLDKPQGNWELASYYLIIGLPLPLYKIES